MELHDAQTTSRDLLLTPGDDFKATPSNLIRFGLSRIDQ